jgi:hypothetical protein
MHDVRMSLFGLIEEYNRVGASSDRFGKLTAFFVANIARRRTVRRDPVIFSMYSDISI